MDHGIWTVGESETGVYLESSDFSFDGRLYINGDFDDVAQELAYAKSICYRLNINKQENPYQTAPVAHLHPEGDGATVFDIKFAWMVHGTTEPIALYVHPSTNQSKLINVVKNHIEDLAHCVKLFRSYEPISAHSPF